MRQNARNDDDMIIWKDCNEEDEYKYWEKSQKKLREDMGLTDNNAF